MNSGTFVTNDRMCWESIISGSCMRGRIAEHNVFKEKSSPTNYAKRNIENAVSVISHKQYMSSKPDKFGIKFWLAADVDSKHVLNGLPNLGKDEECPENLYVRIRSLYIRICRFAFNRTF
ncbi:hypothetical protein TNCV_1774861 [Trichonephila clavipes]|nr:hypothetical protein TNCV_1774861 [Trichonephila clavipes]